MGGSGLYSSLFYFGGTMVHLINRVIMHHMPSSPQSTFERENAAEVNVSILCYEVYENYLASLYIDHTQ